MSDAFDQFSQWRDKPPGSRLAISNQIYGAVMSLPEAERTSREAVNAAAENWAELRRRGQTVWVYLNDFEHGHQRKPGDSDWVKLFGSDDAADRWLQKHDPEGVAWEYKVEEAPRRAALWIYLADEHSSAIGDPAWAKLFASRQAAEQWLEQNASDGTIWNYPLEE
ncbi:MULTISPECIES: hypothetical protein [Bradyrhizobium]|uniref:hypothetical protein n=1 Tax=Bradyrhizobium TaxID=374 RepID=UPI000418DFB1|nr:MULTISPECIES: hypothetical protein [Bradyrhizobium]UFW46564.1 hypothetical protein BaraCB756_30315 [Bradyrhizobium arachidis]